MNILMTITVIFLSGETVTEELALFKTEESCYSTAAMIEEFIENGTKSVKDFMITCEPLKGI